jgi:hypothetical protein
MPFVPQHPKLRFALPVPDRKRGLWRGCVWAVDPRHTYGHRGDASNLVAGFDSVSRKRGISTNGVITAGMMERNSVMNWSYRSGVGLNRGIEWTEANAQYTWGNGKRVTIAVMFRFIGAVPVADRVILTKRFSTGVGNTGVQISLTAAGFFRFSWASGVAEQSIDSTSAAVAEFTRLIVCRVTESFADIWLNGVRETVVAGPIQAVNSNTIGIQMFRNSGSGLAPINGQIGFAGLWKRSLTNQEIALLHVDPWVMWKPASALGALGAAGLGMDGCKCGGPWLHAWSGLG